MSIYWKKISIATYLIKDIFLYFKAYFAWGARLGPSGTFPSPWTCLRQGADLGGWGQRCCNPVGVELCGRVSLEVGRSSGRKNRSAQSLQWGKGGGGGRPYRGPPFRDLHQVGAGLGGGGTKGVGSRTTLWPPLPPELSPAWARKGSGRTPVNLLINKKYRPIAF
jgi:hypothetical protein